jgi:hypothetical protein
MDNKQTKLGPGTESADIIVLLNQRKTIGLFESRTLNRRFTIVIWCKSQPGASGPQGRRTLFHHSQVLTRGDTSIGSWHASWEQFHPRDGCLVGDNAIERAALKLGCRPSNRPVPRTLAKAPYWMEKVQAALVSAEYRWNRQPNSGVKDSREWLKHHLPFDLPPLPEACKSWCLDLVNLKGHRGIVVKHATAVSFWVAVHCPKG